MQNALAEAPDVLESLESVKTILLTTYRRDGSPVSTPVSIAVDGGRAFFRTYDRAGKARRLRRNPGVTVAPSTFRGKQIGPPVRARVRLLEGEDAKQARHALSRKHPLLQGVFVPLIHRMKGYRTLHYELIPLPG